MTNDAANQTALDAFREILGPKGYNDNADDLAPWLTDWRGRYTGKASAMLSPANSDEVAAVVKIAAKYRTALVPQGGNSGMVAGATPDDSGNAALLSLRRMNRILNIDTQARSVTCEAGVILQNLHEAVAAQNLRFPLTLGGKGSATIGGLISTNAGGTQVLRHGTMRALVEGVEAVLPDGSRYEGLLPLKKDNRGYDLKHLMIGAEGTLGIVTAATLQLAPALIDRCVVWAGTDSPQDAYRLLLFVQSRLRGALEGFELMPAEAIDNVVAHIGGTRAPLTGRHRWHVLMEIVQDDGAAPAPQDIAADCVGDALGAELIADAVLSANEAQAEAFWKIRDSIAEAERAEGPALQHDISVPVADMARFIIDETPKVERAFAGTQVIAFGHLGDGNIHYHVKAPGGVVPADWYAEYSGPIARFVYDRVAEYKGSISAEHGIGQLKIGDLARLADPARLSVLRAVKMALDPGGIMNPGKLVPLA